MHTGPATTIAACHETECPIAMIAGSRSRFPSVVDDSTADRSSRILGCVTPAEGLARLGLQMGATREQIDDAWRTAMKVVHPDVGVTPDEVMAQQLNEAREAALRPLSVRTSDALVPLASSGSIVEPGTSAELPSQRAMRSVVMHHVGRIAYRKRQAAVAAGLSALVGAVLALTSAFAKFDFESTRQAVRYWGFGLWVVAAVVGMLAVRIAGLQRSLEMELDEVGETLSDRAAVSDTFREIELPMFFTRADLHDALERWRPDPAVAARQPRRRPLIELLAAMAVISAPTYRSVPLARTARRIGPVDFGKLLLAKALELGMVQEDHHPEDTGDLTYGYRRV